MAEGDLPRVAYRGFLSYSHRDAAAAAKLHRALETYRLPKQLVATGVQERLTPIFRDREELSAGADLSVQVREALAGSESLIILCSPHAKASIWVNKEIETFRALHPDRPILAAIVEGEPDECFPAALTQLPSPFRGEGARRAGEGPIPDERSRSPESASSADPSPQPSPLEGEGATLEPIAADLRKSGDGWRLGQLKLVAGMAGVPLDALVQRDHARQLRRVTAITVASLVTVLIMSALLVFALRAQRDAERQRAEAEGLVEYMLTDLRDRLKGVGRLDVMTAVNERAMGYYGAQGDLSGLEPESLGRRARILHAMGEDDEKRGDLPLALSKFQEAHRTTAAVLAQRPNDSEAIFAHAQSEYWVGYAGWKKKDQRLAGQYWQGYLSQAQALARVEPKSARSFMELGYAHGNLCEFLAAESPTLSEGLKHCERAIGFEQRALAIEPRNAIYAQSLANRMGWMADALNRSGRYDEAKLRREREQLIIDGLLRGDPKNHELRLRQIWPQIGLGNIELAQGNFARAVSILKEARTRLEALSRAAPDDMRAIGQLVRTNLLIARAYRQSDRADWVSYRNEAAELIAEASKSENGEGLLRSSASLAKFDKETKR